MSSNIAYLSNIKDIICFSFHDRNIRFKGPYSLETIKQILEWDDGYLVVNAKYKHSDEPIEDYIDLKPILSRLYIDADTFLSAIDTVEVKMPDNILKEIADAADLIIAGYAFSKNDECIRVLNLEKPEYAAVLDKEGNMIETTMDDVELSLIQSYYLRNKELMEDDA